MNFNNVKDIETAIEKLTPQEYEALRRWFEQYDRPQPIDVQLKADLEAGKIDERIRRAVGDDEQAERDHFRWFTAPARTFGTIMRRCPRTYVLGPINSSAC